MVCPVLVPEIVGKLNIFTKIAKLVVKQGRPARMVVVAADNGIDIAVEGASRIGRTELEALGRRLAS